MPIDATSLAPYATFQENSKGRLYKDENCKYRSVYGKDRDRIINSSSFRRLQYKTQVFVNHKGDHYRTRLTHSLEVAQIARWIASGLSVNKDLAEVVSLAHDLGHAAFGHAGEIALNNKMKNYGGFSHNAHTLKILTQLEYRYVEFPGLNLSWEMLEGVVKHNGPLNDQKKIQQYILDYNKIHDLDLTRFPSIEAQISAIADDIAYNNHDIEDGIRADLFEVEQLFSLNLVGEKFREVLKKYPLINKELLVSEAKKNLITSMVLDVIENTKKNIKEAKIKNAEDIRNLGHPLVHFSKEIELAHQELKKFLMKNMYRHYLVNRMTAKATQVVSGLFDFFMENPHCLPDQKVIENISNKKDLAILVSDYIAGMTDRFALREFEELV